MDLKAELEILAAKKERLRSALSDVADVVDTHVSTERARVPTLDAGHRAMRMADLQCLKATETHRVHATATKIDGSIAAIRQAIAALNNKEPGAEEAARKLIS
jgi:hypothetical protein